MVKTVTCIAHKQFERCCLEMRFDSRKSIKMHLRPGFRPGHTGTLPQTP